MSGCTACVGLMTDDKIYVVRIPTRDSLLFCVPALTADLE